MVAWFIKRETSGQCFTNFGFFDWVSATFKKLLPFFRFCQRPFIDRDRQSVFLSCAGPVPGEWRFRQPSSDWVALDIPGYDPENLVRFDSMATIAALINSPCADTVRFLSPADGVSGAEPLHCFGKSRPRSRTCEHMPMIWHHTKGMDLKRKYF